MATPSCRECWEKIVWLCTHKKREINLVNRKLLFVGQPSGLHILKQSVNKISKLEPYSIKLFSPQVWGNANYKEPEQEFDQEANHVVGNEL